MHLMEKRIAEKFRECMSKKLEIFRETGKQMTDKEIADVFFEEGAKAWVYWNIDEIKGIALAEGLLPPPVFILKKILMKCLNEYDFSHGNILFYLRTWEEQTQGGEEYE